MTTSTAQLVRSADPLYVTINPGAPQNYVLPTGAGVYFGLRVVVLNQSSTNILTIVASDNSVVRTVYPLTSGEVMANQANPTTNSHWEGVGIVQSFWTTYTPAFSAAFGTPSSSNSIYRRNGDSLEHIVRVSSGTLTAALGTIAIALGNIDATKLLRTTTASAGGQGSSVGYFTSDNNTALGTMGSVLVASTTSTTVVYCGGGSGGSGATGTSRIVNMTNYNNTTEFYFTFAVPISGWTPTKG